jgi:hypothetical protein
MRIKCMLNQVFESSPDRGRHCRKITKPSVKFPDHVRVRPNQPSRQDNPQPIVRRQAISDTCQLITVLASVLRSFSVLCPLPLDSSSLVGAVDDDLAGLDLWCGLTWVKTLKRAVFGASAVLTKPEPVFVFLFKNHTSLSARASAGGAGICLPRAAVHYRPV